MTSNPSKILTEINRRRTFAIISHPDAGKTTLTEKLLLYGGAIHLAGAVKAKANQRHTTSDWMEIEKQRGISVSSTVLQFEYQGHQINLLDTPGHKDFSEDTYRTLAAADAAVMLIDAAKGVEPQTRKLFEVCRMRGIPIFTFVNKMDRPAREVFDLMDEIEKLLELRCVPMTVPIGSGDRFRGVYDRETKEFLLYDRGDEANVKGKLSSFKVKSTQDEQFRKLLAGPKNRMDEVDELITEFETNLALLEEAGDQFDQEKVNQGELSPMFFGSAMNNFGVEAFLEKFITLSPKPAARKTNQGTQAPESEHFSAFIFKIQANMDPSHRDRVAFMRVCSGKFERAIQVKHMRIDKKIKLAMPFQIFAQERQVVEEAWPGDVVGLVDTTGDLRIGDTLSNDPSGFEFDPIPSFSPENFSSIRIKDPMKRKQLQKGLEQLSEEGVIQLYKQRGMGDKDPVLGAVGALQLEVLKHRLESEYKVDVILERLPYVHARWVTGEKLSISDFEHREDSFCVLDRDENPVLLFKSDWGLRYAMENHKDLEFLTQAPLKRR